MKPLDLQRKGRGDVRVRGKGQLVRVSALPFSLFFTSGGPVVPMPPRFPVPFF